MRRDLTMMLALAATTVASACADNPTAAVSPELSIRAARPAQPLLPGITVRALGNLSYVKDGMSSSAPIAFALNNGASRSLTRVVGSTRYDTNPEHPFTWTEQAGIAPLAVVEPRRGWPLGVSDNGIIVGEINTSNGLRPFVVTAGGPMTYLTLPSGFTSGGASGITADGSCISGRASNGGASTAVVWRNAVVEILGPGSAGGVSKDCLVVVGSSGGRAAIWEKSGTSWAMDTLPSRGPGSKFVGPLIGAEGIDISPSGEFVSGRRRDSASATAVVWRRTNSGWTATDLENSIYAFGVDNSGRAVGNSSKGEPTVWTRGSTGAYTATMLPPLDRSTEGWAAGINELGQIAGRSRNRSGWQPVMWTITTP